MAPDDPAGIEGLMAEIEGVRKGELLAIREFGTNDGPGSTYPSFDKSGDLLRVPGEAILWRRSACQPSCVRTRGSTSECVWTLPGTSPKAVREVLVKPLDIGLDFGHDRP